MEAERGEGDLLVCPQCHGALERTESALSCRACLATFTQTAGYLDFTRDPRLREMETTSADYAEDQESGWRRFFDDYLRPWLNAEPAQTVLEVGCGLGMGVRYLIEAGKDAYGVDVPCLAPFWTRLGNDAGRFFCSDGARMPFASGYFDAVYSLGVIEHIGTEVGHYTLHTDYADARAAFAAELLRVTRPGGRILVSCPNKSFPVDTAHEPTDAATPPGRKRFRRYVYDRTGLTIHWPWGPYHLLSYGEVRRLFCAEGGARGIRALPLRGYFTFNRFGSGPFGMFRKLVAAYVNNLPGLLRPTCFNPFVVAEIRK